MSSDKKMIAVKPQTQVSRPGTTLRQGEGESIGGRRQLAELFPGTAAPISTLVCTLPAQCERLSACDSLMLPSAIA